MRLVPVIEREIAQASLRREKRRSEVKLCYLSTHDMLTGIYNRGYFGEELLRLKKGRRYPFPSSWRRWTG